MMNEEMMPIQQIDILRAACCVAGIDGKANKAELEVLDRMARNVGVGKASLAAMVERAETDPDFHEEQFRILKFEPTATMTSLLEVAVADQEISDPEIEVLEILAQRLEIEPELFKALIGKVRSQFGQS